MDADMDDGGPLPPTPDYSVPYHERSAEFMAARLRVIEQGVKLIGKPDGLDQTTLAILLAMQDYCKEAEWERNKQVQTTNSQLQDMQAQASNQDTELKMLEEGRENVRSLWRTQAELVKTQADSTREVIESLGRTLLTMQNGNGTTRPSRVFTMKLGALPIYTGIKTIEAVFT